MSVAAVVVAWRAGAQAGVCLQRLAEVAPTARRILVDNEAGDGSGVDAPDDTAVVRLSENRGFAGGANAGLARAFDDGAAHAVLLNDDVLVEPGCIESARRRRRAMAARRRRASKARRASRSAGQSSSSKRGFGRHVDGASDYLTGACLCISRGAWEAVGPFDEKLFLYYEDVDWCLRARALGVPLTVALKARATHSGGASSGGERGETWAYYSTRNRLWVLEQQRGARHARREAIRTSARARVRALQPARRAVSQAKLAGVRDWSERQYGEGPVAPLKVAFDVACLTQTRAGTARLAIGLRDALRVREDIELIELGGQEWKERGSFGQKRDALQQDLALVRAAARQGGARARGRHAALPDVPRALCANPACRPS